MMDHCVFCDRKLLGSPEDWCYDEFVRIKVCHECETTKEFQNTMKFLKRIYEI